MPQGPALFYVDSDGTRLRGDLFSVGSGSTFAYGVLDQGYSYDMEDADAQELGRRSIYAAAHRDAFSGNTVNLFHVREDGWEFVSTVTPLAPALFECVVLWTRALTPAPPSQIENVDVNELHYVRLNCCRIYLTIPTLIIFFNLTGAQVRLRAQDRSRGGGEGCCRRRRPGRGLILSRGSH